VLTGIAEFWTPPLAGDPSDNASLTGTINSVLFVSCGAQVFKGPANGKATLKGQVQ